MHFGDQPVHSNALDAWLIAAPPHLIIAHDRAGTRPWRTEAERERAEKEHAIAEKQRARTEKEREQAARVELERRVSELEAKLG